MFAKTLKKFGAKGATLIFTVGTVVLSLVLTKLSAILIGEPLPRMAVGVAVLFPIIIGSPPMFFHFRALEEVSKSRKELALTNQKLKKALSEVKELGGLLPICSYCKKIRDDQGYWNQLEIYIRDHSKAEFSHGFCPDCAEKIGSSGKCRGSD